MIEKIDIKQVLYIGVACLAINFLFGGCSKSDTIDQLQSNTDRTLGTIKAEQSIVSVETERIRIASGSIGESVNSAAREVGESRRTSETIANGIEQIKRTLAECQRLTGENARIIDNVERANQRGTEKTESDRT